MHIALTNQFLQQHFPTQRERIQLQLRRTPSAVMVRVLLDLAGSMPNAPGTVGLILAFAAVVALVGITVFNCADGMDKEKKKKKTRRNNNNMAAAVAANTAAAAYVAGGGC